MKRWVKRNDETVYLMGEEVAEYNGAYKHLKECLPSLEKKSNWYPIAELGFTGIAVGSAMNVDHCWIHDFQFCLVLIKL
jgi:pyruvate dehydrogenase E1 component beta subunit